ncbi:MAG: hypothetical protein ACTXOO_02305 [Sodalis sp. (in: enterobacteria)]
MRPDGSASCGNPPFSAVIVVITAEILDTATRAVAVVAEAALTQRC